jgi:peptidoglycan lytic transglycosylase G
MKNRQQGGIVSGLIKFIVTLALVFVIICAAGFFYAKYEYERSGPASEAAVVLVKPGMGSGEIATLLEEKGLIRSDKYFRVAVRLQKLGGQLQAGEFEIPAEASLQEIIDILVEGNSILYSVTVPEGRTTKQVLALVAANEVLTGEITIEPAEGDLLPETYAFTRGDTRNGVIERMMEAHDEVLDRLWESRADDLPFDTKEEAVTLASIVEKETALPEERPQVASVFVNRLRKGMRLQSDPTIIYGLTGGEPLGRGLRVSELRRETPYNTYVIRGLPPTPIANPGEASLAAVLNPADTDYLYFVADGTGGHAFAANLRDHNRNVAKWRAIEAERSTE